MPLPDEFLRELRDNNDIVQVGSSYVELKRTGSTYSCRCPFHSERTPSCHFYPSTQSFYCFGCGAGGDVITFIKLIENLDYIEAVKFLAQRAGMDMPEERADHSAEQRRRLYEINRAAGKYFYSLLFSEGGKAGLDYLLGRGLSIETIKKFGLGYAANDYHALHFYMRKLGYSDDELCGAALLTRYENKVYDKFRDRVIFPIIDLRGNIIGFGGRALSSDAKAKYLNSDETLVFHKREGLYALNFAKNSKADMFILCEGYMDVIAMHQAGFDCAVATLGTAITPSQARLIGRMGKKEVVLAYDSDEAGQKATSRGINLFAEAGIKARVLKVENAKDPDEFIKRFGAEAFSLLISGSGSAMDFEMNKLALGLDLDTDDGKATYIKRAVAFLAGVNNLLDREIYISRAAKTSGIAPASVKEAVNAEIKRTANRSKRESERELIHPRAADKVNPDSYKLPREEKAERGIICFLYHNAGALSMIEQRLKFPFATEFNRRVFEQLSAMIKNGRSPDISLFNEEFDGGGMGRITSIINDDTFAYDEETVKEYIDVLNAHGESASRKSTAEMSAEEMLRLAQELKESKK